MPLHSGTSGRRFNFRGLSYEYFHVIGAPGYLDGAIVVGDSLIVVVLDYQLVLLSCVEAD